MKLELKPETLRLEQSVFLLVEAVNDRDSVGCVCRTVAGILQDAEVEHL